MNETAIVCTSANRHGETFACPLTKNGPLNAAARRPRPPLEPDRCDERGKARSSRAREASRRCIEPIRPRQASVIRARLGGWKQGEPRARRRDGRRHTGAACRPESHTARDGRMRLSIAEIERAQALSRRDAACRTTAPLMRRGNVTADGGHDAARYSMGGLAESACDGERAPWDVVVVVVVARRAASGPPGSSGFHCARRIGQHMESLQTTGTGIALAA